MFQWISSYPSKVIIGGTVSVDTFFVISGTLLTYTFLTHAQNTDQVNWFLFYFLRYVRIAAPTSVGVIVFACAIQFFGSGPLWTDTYYNMQMACQKFWWSSLLFIQNYVNSESMVSSFVLFVIE